MSIQVKAKVTFYPREKKRFYSNKYRPAFKIREDMFNTGQIEFLNKEKVYSGESVEAIITLTHKEYVPYLAIGKIIYLYEGFLKLGEGVIKDIIE